MVQPACVIRLGIGSIKGINNRNTLQIQNMSTQMLGIKPSQTKHVHCERHAFQQGETLPHFSVLALLPALTLQT